MITVTPEIHGEYEEYLLKIWDKADENDGRDKACLEYAYFVMSDWSWLRFLLGDDYIHLGEFTEGEIAELKAKLAEKRQDVEDDIKKLEKLCEESNNG